MGVYRCTYGDILIIEGDKLTVETPDGVFEGRLDEEGRVCAYNQTALSHLVRAVNDWIENNHLPDTDWEDKKGYYSVMY